VAGMDTEDILAKRWLDRFLAVRGVSVPDGRPLYAYRCMDDEFASLTQLLGELLPRLVGRPGAPIAALFCLLASEWWRRHYTGGPWAWELIFGTIGSSQEAFNPRDLTRKGLGYWRRPIRHSTFFTEYLVSLILEGGIPLGLVAAGRGFAYYLRRVMEDLSLYGPNETFAVRFAEQHAKLIARLLQRNREFLRAAGEIPLRRPGHSRPYSGNGDRQPGGRMAGAEHSRLAGYLAAAGGRRPGATASVRASARK